MSNLGTEISATLRLAWTPVGAVIKDAGGKIKFPKLSTRGGLYRFSVRRIDGSRAVYVGESDNIQRRFSHYRNPGQTQPTNIRINALFIAILDRGGQVDVSVVTDMAWIKSADQEEVADFRRKDIRRLFENFVLVTQKAAEIEELNK